jgi:colanic acid biosynthesis protein WcaH
MTKDFLRKEQIDQPLYKQIVQTMPVLCVDIVIIQDSKILVVKRRNNPLKGVYFTPGGRIYRGETIEEAVRRKAKEELNIELEFIERISFYEEFFKKNAFDDTGSQTDGFFCLCIPKKNQKIKLNEEGEDYQWLPFDSKLLHPITKMMLEGKKVIHFEE